jgi:hypothetical protein
MLKFQTADQRIQNDSTLEPPDNIIIDTTIQADSNIVDASIPADPFASSAVLFKTHEDAIVVDGDTANEETNVDHCVPPGTSVGVRADVAVDTEINTAAGTAEPTGLGQVLRRSKLQAKKTRK